MWIEKTFFKNNDWYAQLRSWMANGTQICLFGVGLRGCQFMEYLSDVLDFACDNDSGKWGKTFGKKNIPCISPEDLKQKTEDTKIACFVSVLDKTFQKQILKQLECIGMVGAVVLPRALSDLNLVNFSRFDWQGYNDSQMRWLCDAYRVFSVVKDWTSHVYGNNAMREYAFYPNFLPLYCHAMHGEGIITAVYSCNIEHDMPIFLLKNQHSLEEYQKESKVPCYCIPSPIAWYRNKHHIKQSASAKGTLVWVMHELATSTALYDIDEYICKLRNLPQDFQPICACFHPTDVGKGLHRKWLERGVSVYTIGHTADRNYQQRFYGLLRNFRYTTSMVPTSGMWLALEMGVPFFLFGGETAVWRFENTPEYGTGTFHWSKEFDRSTFYFNDQQTNSDWYVCNFSYKESAVTISLEQKQLARKVLGLEDGIGRLHLAKIFYKAYFQKENLCQFFSRFYKYIKTRIQEHVS